MGLVDFFRETGGRVRSEAEDVGIAIKKARREREERAEEKRVERISTPSDIFDPVTGFRKKPSRKLGPKERSFFGQLGTGLGFAQMPQTLRKPIERKFIFKKKKKKKRGKRRKKRSRK